MTNKEFAAITRALQPCLQDFVVKVPLVFIPPARPILRGLCFDRSDDKRYFYLEAFVLPLFVPTEDIYFNFGDRVRNRVGSGRWNADEPNLLQELETAVVDQALPYLREFEAPRDLVKLSEFGEAEETLHETEAIAYALAFDRKAAASIATLDRLLSKLDRTSHWQEAMAKRAELLRADLLDDPAKAQRRLAAWEAETIRNLKLEEFC